MKITRKQLRRIVRESFTIQLTEAPSDIENIGQLKAALKGASQSKRDEQGKGALKDLGKGILADLIPGGGTISSIFDLVKATYSMDDSKRTGSALDALDVDDHVSAIVDDNVENRFIKTVAEKIKGLDDDIPIRNLNMTKMLSQFLEKEFDSRTVAGFQEGKQIKITRDQLRTIVEQVIGYTAPSKKSSDDDSGYETVGTMGKDVSLDDDSPDAQQARSQNIKSLTAQRQDALDKDDIEGAEEAGEQLSQAYSLKEAYSFTFSTLEK